MQNWAYAWGAAGLWARGDFSPWLQVLPGKGMDLLCMCVGVERDTDLVLSHYNLNSHNSMMLTLRKGTCRTY